MTTFVKCARRYLDDFVNRNDLAPTGVDVDVPGTEKRDRPHVNGRNVCHEMMSKGLVVTDFEKCVEYFDGWNHRFPGPNEKRHVVPHESIVFPPKLPTNNCFLYWALDNNITNFYNCVQKYENSGNTTNFESTATTSAPASIETNNHRADAIDLTDHQIYRSPGSLTKRDVSTDSVTLIPAPHPSCTLACDADKPCWDPTWGYGFDIPPTLIDCYNAGVCSYKGYWASKWNCPAGLLVGSNRAGQDVEVVNQQWIREHLTSYDDDDAENNDGGAMGDDEDDSSSRAVVKKQGIGAHMHKSRVS